MRHNTIIMVHLFSSPGLKVYMRYCHHFVPIVCYYWLFTLSNANFYMKLSLEKMLPWWYSSFYMILFHLANYAFVLAEISKIFSETTLCDGNITW
jgi:hypothetical protein